MKQLNICANSWNGKFDTNSTLLGINSFDFLSDDSVVKQIKADYELIQQVCKDSGFDALSGKLGVLIQPRTKGSGHGSKTRAFYARKELVKMISVLEI